ncbi:hypothetical protein QPM05_14825 [Caldibacillus thermoamylovorans]|nr:hypothetical protein [Caldibacillus thermoamylovorans]
MKLKISRKEKHDKEVEKLFVKAALQSGKRTGAKLVGIRKIEDEKTKQHET